MLSYRKLSSILASHSFCLRARDKLQCIYSFNFCHRQTCKHKTNVSLPCTHIKITFRQWKLSSIAYFNLTSSEIAALAYGRLQMGSKSSTIWTLKGGKTWEDRTLKRDQGKLLMIATKQESCYVTWWWWNHMLHSNICNHT